MRVIAGTGGILVVMAIAAAVQYSIISDNIRNREVKRGIECAFDYCLDAGFEDREEFVSEFSSVLEMCMITDGNLSVYVVEEGWEDGFMDIVVEETYDYGFFGKKGFNRWERAYKADI